MPRICKYREISNPPHMTGYKPFGIPVLELEEVRLLLEEFEAFRLVGYEALPQDEAAARMHVSRPTFTRIYNRSLKKIAEAFALGKVLIIEGGRVRFEGDWYKCSDCFHTFRVDEGERVVCRHCDSQNVSRLHMKEENNGSGPGGYCICMHCNTRVPHTEGKPCRREKCPNCGKMMIRENSFHHKQILQKKKDKEGHEE
jgi:predicted DNA-binding protein (UPF0251 family)